MSVDDKPTKELATTAFACRAESLVLLGLTGVGKTHLAVALFAEALPCSISVYFTTLTKLIKELKAFKPLFFQLKALVAKEGASYTPAIRNLVNRESR